MYCFLNIKWPISWWTGMAPRVRDGGSKSIFDQLESVNVEVWPTRVGQCWGLTNSSRSMLRFDQLESVNVEVWPTRVGQCWGLINSNQSMLRYDQLESVNVEVWPTRILLLNKILALAIFDGPTQVSNMGGGGVTPPTPLEPSLMMKHPQWKW